MRYKERTPIIIVCLFSLVMILAAVHIATRTEVPKGLVAVEAGEKTFYLILNDLRTSHVEGEIVNGKGDVKTISGNGIRLEDALAVVGVTNPKQVTAVADDEYSAVIEGDEIALDQVYLLVENGTGRLVVFGDSNSKRNVSHLTRLLVK